MFTLAGAVFIKSPEQEKRQKTDAEPEAEAAPADVPGPAGVNEKEASGAKKVIGVATACCGVPGEGEGRKGGGER